MVLDLRRGNKVRHVLPARVVGACEQCVESLEEYRFVLGEVVVVYVRLRWRVYEVYSLGEGYVRRA